MAKKPKKINNTIAQNKKARFDYDFHERFEAGVALEGWEVKSLREGKCQLTDSYVIIKKNEAWLLGAQIQPLSTAATHVITDTIRTRKLLLKRREIDKLRTATEQKGYTIVATGLLWKRHLVKCSVAIARGKQQHDKRETEKQRDWNRQKQRVLSVNNK
jgi:SsrA-binding protein